MKLFSLLMLLLSPLVVLGQTAETSTEEKPEKRVFGKSEEESYEGKVVLIKIGRDDLINSQSFKFMRRTLHRARDEKARAVVFDIDTPGGQAYETKKLMTELVELEIDSYAFVNPEAISAGALVSVATKAIYMTPDSLIGDAGLINSMGTEIDEVTRAKLESYFDASVRKILKRTGYDLELVRAMMFLSDEDRVFGDLTVKKGTLLTLTADEAIQEYKGKPLLASGIVEDLDAMLKEVGLEEYAVVKADPTAFEKIAWWIKYFSPILILIGLGAGYAEMKAPGFGVFGLVSLIAFAIFFFGNYIAGNLAGYELAAIFVLGLLLLALELFVIPGTGVTGILGALMVAGSLLFGMIDQIDFTDFNNEDFSLVSLGELLSWPAMSLSIGLFGSMILMMLMMRYFTAIPGMSFLTLKKELADGPSMDVLQGAKTENRVGWTGKAVTDLRPAGKADFNGEILDVVTEGSFVANGESVRIVEEEGMRIEVQKA